MSVIYVLLTISIVVAVIFFAAFIVAVKNGQYDDAYTPSVRMLFEDELVQDPPSRNTAQKAYPNREKNCNTGEAKLSTPLGRTNADQLKESKSLH